MGLTEPQTSRTRELAAGTPWPGPPADRGCPARRAIGQMARGQDWAEAVRLAELALRQGPCRDDPLCVWRAVITLTNAGELATADAHGARLVGDVDPRLAGPVQRRAMRLQSRARIARLRGDFAGARGTMEELLGLAVPRPMRLVTVAWLAETLLGLGAVDEAESLLARHDFDAVTQWRAACQPMLLAARGAVRTAAGRAQAGLRDHLASGRAFLAQGMVNPAVVGWRGRAARAALAARREDLALSLAEQELALARRWGEPRTLGSALATVAVVRGGDGVAALTEAAELLEVARAHGELGEVQLELGRRLARSGAGSRDLGAARDRLRAARELGGPSGVAAAAALRALGSAEVLTGREERVVRLVRAGLGNREIAERLGLATRTVELSLSRAYRKLGVRGRAGLREARF